MGLLLVDRSRNSRNSKAHNRERNVEGSIPACGMVGLGLPTSTCRFTGPRGHTGAQRSLDGDLHSTAV